jgi:indole-3-glycerol phosphate synthase
MTGILEQILNLKEAEVRERRELYPIKLLEREPCFSAPTISLKRYLMRDDLVGIIAEIKRRSPSKGVVNENISVEDLSIGYMQAGASALSVLTDAHFFGGSNADLKTARRCNFAPILRKDFIVDEYQVIEARAIGADAILLIAAALSSERCKQLASVARSLGLEVLLEVHSAVEIQTHCSEDTEIIGVNNRDLKSFSVSLESSKLLIDSIPKHALAVAESGIDSPDTVIELKGLGYRGFLIGEAFMREAVPADACRRFIERIGS